MPKAFTPKVVTANDLLLGDVIYMAADGTWVRSLAQAEIISDEAEAQIRLLDAARQQDRAVGAYLADVTAGTRGPAPVHFREAFRATGPSNHAHGKQAETHDV
ncbi:MAG: DUF2849 domain-containing protein [Rhodobacteraceae bacterium]|nr:DUF2849 domain-containing protein [Paracoccaceae bacterium]